MKYRLIKTYPNSPSLGTVVDSAETNFYLWKPSSYPEFWEKLTGNPIVIDTKLNKVEMYSKVWIIDNGDIKQIVLTPDHVGDFYLFSTDATVARDRDINLIVEDCIVTEECTLYGLLPKAQWETCSVEASYLYKRSKQFPERKSAWIYFKSEQSRQAYIDLYKPQYSLNQIYFGLNPDMTIREVETALKEYK